MSNKIILLIALMITVGACQQKELETIISGKLPGVKNKEISLIPVSDYFPGLKSNGNYITTDTDSLGVFTFKFNQNEPTYYQIINSNYHALNYDIFLEPGDSIYIEQSPWNEQAQLIISGKGSEKLKHLIKDYEVFSKDKSFYDKIKSDSFPKVMDFKRYIDSIHLKRVNTLNSNPSIPVNLKSHLLNTIKAEKARFLLEHLERRSYYMNSEFDYFFPEKAYYTFLDSIDFDNFFCKTTAAKLFANTYLMNKAKNAFKGESEDKWWDENLTWKFNYISSQPKSEWTDITALSTISEYSFGLMNDGFFDDLPQFKEKVDSLFYSERYGQLYKSNISSYLNLAPGRPAPDFELPDSNDVLHRLSDYKGKIVYLDFWGTWCYPCIQEIPDALLLQEKYKDQPVVFMYVAMEYDSTNIANWKKFIAGQNENFGKLLNYKPFPGVHLVAEKQFRNDEISPYKINFAPTHALVDHQGNIVYSRAKRSKEISEDIDKLLEEIDGH